MKMKPIYGTTMAGTEAIIDLWLAGNEYEATKALVLHISINKPETICNTHQMAKETIEKWIEDNL
jgi:hypothetical protein